MDPQTYTVRQLLHFSLMGGKFTVGSDVRGMRAHVPPTLQYFFLGGGERELNFIFFLLNFASRVGGAAQAQASSLCAWSGSSFNVLSIVL